MTDRVNIKNSQAGYSMLELLLAIFVGSIVLAGTYGSYSVISMQFQRNSGVSDIRDFAMPTLKIISRDLRMAGYRHVDANIESTFDRIDPPISITDTANTCCDSISVTYDKSETSRVRITYFVSGRTNPVRNALFMDIDSWDGSAWVEQVDNAIVADYVEDFQVEADDLNSDGYPTTINLNMVFTSRNKTKTSNTFTKSDYGSGNNNSYSITDHYLREEFDTTVRLRNLIDYQ